MKRFYRHLTTYLLFLFICVQVAQLTIAGCSHTKPYYRAGVEQGESVAGALRYRLLLLGDGGTPKPEEPVLRTLREWAARDAANTTLVFLGDNMYPEGMTARKRHEASARLLPQLSVIKDTGVHGFFIPGNHDWASAGSEGYAAVLAQAAFINNALGGETHFLPADGRPGPVALDLPETDPVLRLVVLDTQWWLHRHEKPADSPERVLAELARLLETELPVIVVGHHPLASYGPHGGYFDWRSHLFPLRVWKKWLWVPVPLLGSAYPHVRWHLYRSDQDMSGSRNREMVAALKGAFAGRQPPPQGPPLFVYVSGHEHSLQVLTGEVTDYLLVSGAAASRKVTEVLSGDRTLFAHQHTGFMAIDFLAGGEVLLRVVEPAGAGVLFQHRLR